MAKTRPPDPVPRPLTNNPLARVAGRDAPLHQLLPRAAPVLGARGLDLLQPGADPLDDYAQVDPSLARMPLEALQDRPFARSHWPANGLGYIGFDPEARTRFLLWLDALEHDAPPSFQTLFLAQVETALVEAAATANGAQLEQAIAALRALEAWPHWQANEQRARTLLLAYLLQGDGGRLASWLGEGAPTVQVAGVALGQQARLGAALTPAEVLTLARLWHITEERLNEGVVSLRLRSLTESLGADPLAHALRAAALPPADLVDAPGDHADDSTGDSAGDSAPGARLPWRTAHRDLRLAFAQPDLEPHLAPLFAEMLDDVPLAPKPAAAVAEAPAAGEAETWTLILEFGHSRSEYFEFALKQAQRLPGYSALVDEQRHVVHRVHLKKSEMRRFWQLWEYAMNWSDTHVYVNGVELDKWKIYPYSQFLS